MPLRLVGDHRISMAPTGRVSGQPARSAPATAPAGALRPPSCRRPADPGDERWLRLLAYRRRFAGGAPTSWGASRRGGYQASLWCSEPSVRPDRLGNRRASCRPAYYPARRLRGHSDRGSLRRCRHHGLLPSPRDRDDERRRADNGDGGDRARDHRPGRWRPPRRMTDARDGNWGGGILLSTQDGEDDAARRRLSRISIGLALIAAVSIGSGLAAFDRAADSGVLGAVVWARVVSISALLVVVACARPRTQVSARISRESL